MTPPSDTSPEPPSEHSPDPYVEQPWAGAPADGVTGWPDAPGDHRAPPPEAWLPPNLVEPLPYAAWPERLGAWAIDSVPMFFVGWVVDIFVEGTADAHRDPSTGQTTASVHWTLVLGLFAVPVLLGFVNWGILQGRTGQSVGKRLVGLAVYRAHTTSRPGIVRGIARYFARFLDFLVCYLGTVWPLWDEQRRTFADMLCGTRVYKLPRAMPTATAAPGHAQIPDNPPPSG